MTDLATQHLNIPAAASRWAVRRMADLLDLLRIDREELESVALFGLARGVREWDASRSGQGEKTYGSYLVKHARWEILRFIEWSRMEKRHPGGNIVLSLDRAPASGEDKFALKRTLAVTDSGLALVEYDDLAVTVRRLLAHLGDKDRECVESCLMRGETQRDVGRRLGVTGKMVSHRLTRGVKTLRKMMAGRI